MAIRIIIFGQPWSTLLLLHKIEKLWPVRQIEAYMKIYHANNFVTDWSIGLPCMQIDYYITC